MLGPREIPSQFQEWNEKWQAPFGPAWGRDLRLDEKLRPATAERLGPFAFQSNNSTRKLEYPWVFEHLDLLPGLSVLEIGGALAGLQFVLARHGAKVTNTDPFLEYGASDEYPGNPEQLHARLNKSFGTDVVLERATLAERRFPAGSFDRAVCVSTIEHMRPDEISQTMKEIYRVLKRGALFVLTVDLFLDLFPFARRRRNRWGTNVSIRWLLQQTRFTLIAGNKAELFGYARFDARRIKARLDNYLVGEYPALVQCLVLQK